MSEVKLSPKEIQEIIIKIVVDRMQESFNSKLEGWSGKIKMLNYEVNLDFNIKIKEKTESFHE